MTGPASMVMSFASEKKLSIEPANVEFARTHIPEQVAKIADVRTAVKVMAELQDALTAHKAGDLSTYFHKLEGIARDLVGDAKRADFLKACANPPTGDLAMGAYREVGCLLVALTFASGTSSGSLAKVGDDLSTHPAHVFIRSIARGILNRLHTDSGGSVSATEDHAAALAREIRRIVESGTAAPGSDVLKMMNAFPNKGIQDNHGVVVAKLLKAVGSDPAALATVAKILTDRLCQKPFVPPASSGLARVSTPNLNGGVPDAGIITLTRVTGTMAPGDGSDPGGLSSGPNSNPWMSALGQAFQDLRGKCDKLRELFRSRPVWTADDWAVEAYNIIDPGMQLTVGQRPANGTALLLATIFATKLVEKYFVIDESVEHSQTRTLWERGLACAQTTLPWGVALGAFEAAYRLQPGDEKQKILAGFSAARSAWEWTIEAARRQSTQAGIPPFVAPPTPPPAPTPTAPPVIDPHVRDLGYGKFEIDLVTPISPAEAKLHDIVGAKISICLDRNICTVQVVTRQKLFYKDPAGGQKFLEVERNVPQYIDLAIPRWNADMDHDTLPAFVRTLRRDLQAHIDVGMRSDIDATEQGRSEVRKRMTNVGSMLRVVQSTFDGVRATMTPVNPDAEFFGVVRLLIRDQALERGELFTDPEDLTLHEEPTSLTGIRVVGSNLRVGHQRADSGNLPWVSVYSPPVSCDGTVFELSGDCSLKRVGGVSTRIVTGETELRKDDGGVYGEAAVVPPQTGVQTRAGDTRTFDYPPTPRTDTVAVQNANLSHPIVEGALVLKLADVRFANAMLFAAKLDDWSGQMTGVFSKSLTADTFAGLLSDPARPATAFETANQGTERRQSEIGSLYDYAMLLHAHGIHAPKGKDVITEVEKKLRRIFIYPSYDYVNTSCQVGDHSGAISILDSKGLAARIVRTGKDRKRVAPNSQDLQGDHTLYLGNGRAVRFSVEMFSPNGRDHPPHYRVTEVTLIDRQTSGESWKVPSATANQRDLTNANGGRMWMIWEAIFDVIHGVGRHGTSATPNHKDKSRPLFDELRSPDVRGGPVASPADPSSTVVKTPDNDPFMRLRGLITGRDPTTGDSPNNPGKAYQPIADLLANSKSDLGLTYLMQARYAAFCMLKGIPHRQTYI